MFAPYDFNLEKANRKDAKAQSLAKMIDCRESASRRA
jgi:hypothetical protein